MKKIVTTLLFATAILLVAVSTQAVCDNNLITNGDFESGNDGSFISDYDYVASTGSQALWAEAKYAVGSIRVLRIGRSEDEGFEERSIGKLANQWKIFLACKEIYELQKEIRKEK